MSARDVLAAEYNGPEADAILALLSAAGYAVVQWPPSGDDVQACADEVNPYAATAEQYGLTVEMVCDVIDTWMRRACSARRGGHR